jgi:release factor glutamine methyltransferase
VDIIVSNPPYVSLEDFNTLDPELRLFEPRKALTDEGSGYKFYERLASAANTSLAPNGRLVMELGYGMAENVREIILEASLSVLRVVPDLAGIPRVIVAGVRSQTDRGAVS